MTEQWSQVQNTDGDQEKKYPPMTSGVHRGLITMSIGPEGFEYCLRVYFF